jgi:hypothetical protein
MIEPAAVAVAEAAVTDEDLAALAGGAGLGSRGPFPFCPHTFAAACGGDGDQARVRAMQSRLWTVAGVEQPSERRLRRRHPSEGGNRGGVPIPPRRA